MKQAARLFHVLFLVLTAAVVGRIPSHVLPGGRDPGDGRWKGGSGCLAVQEPTLVLRSTSRMLAAAVPGGPQPPDLGFPWTFCPF